MVVRNVPTRVRGPLCHDLMYLVPILLSDFDLFARALRKKQKLFEDAALCLLSLKVGTQTRRSSLLPSYVRVSMWRDRLGSWHGQWTNCAGSLA